MAVLGGPGRFRLLDPPGKVFRMVLWRVFGAVCSVGLDMIAVSGQGPGERAVFGGLFGQTAILPVHAAGGASARVPP